jgi:adenylyltransferase/sulfurtransferase
MARDFTDQELRRYARHIVLREIGGEGQARLLESAVLVVGAGGLGAPALLYLAAAGVGRIGVVDDDRVELSNLQRQIIHRVTDVGRPKTDSARAALAALDPAIRVETHAVRLDADNAAGIVGAYDLVVDGSDNFATRIAVHDACYRLGRPLVSAAIQGFDGQLTTFKAHLGPPHPCLRCLHPETPPEELLPSCAAGGVLGALAGVMGAWQAIEAVKELLAIGQSLSGTLLLHGALDARVDRIKLKRDPVCRLCGSGGGG